MQQYWLCGDPDEKVDFDWAVESHIELQKLINYITRTSLLMSMTKGSDSKMTDRVRNILNDVAKLKVMQVSKLQLQQKQKHEQKVQVLEVGGGGLRRICWLWLGHPGSGVSYVSPESSGCWLLALIQELQKKKNQGASQDDDIWEWMIRVLHQLQHKLHAIDGRLVIFYNYDFDDSQEETQAEVEQTSNIKMERVMNLPSLVSHPGVLSHLLSDGVFLRSKS
jgi:hypothetical protein